MNQLNLLLCHLLFLFVLSITAEKQCLNLNEDTYICCNGIPQPKSLGSKCCGTRIYNPDKGSCCNDTIVALKPYECCGKNIFHPVVQQCCDNSPALLGIGKLKFNCCGTTSYNANIYQCCNRHVQPKGPHNASYKCCGRQFYNPEVQVCQPDGRVLTKSKSITCQPGNNETDQNPGIRKRLCNTARAISKMFKG